MFIPQVSLVIIKASPVQTMATLLPTEGISAQSCQTKFKQFCLQRSDTQYLSWECDKNWDDNMKMAISSGQFGAVIKIHSIPGVTWKRQIDLKGWYLAFRVFVFEGNKSHDAGAHYLLIFVRALSH